MIRSISASAAFYERFLILKQEERSNLSQALISLLANTFLSSNRMRECCELITQIDQLGERVEFSFSTIFPDRSSRLKASLRFTVGDYQLLSEKRKSELSSLFALPPRREIDRLLLENGDKIEASSETPLPLLIEELGKSTEENDEENMGPPWTRILVRLPRFHSLTPTEQINELFDLCNESSDPKVAEYLRTIFSSYPTSQVIDAIGRAELLKPHLSINPRAFDALSLLSETHWHELPSPFFSRRPLYRHCPRPKPSGHNRHLS